MMLVAAPFGGGGSGSSSCSTPPRVISETRKNCLMGGTLSPIYRPKLTGELLIKCSDGYWRLFRAQIRAGHLHLGSRALPKFSSLSSSSFDFISAAAVAPPPPQPPTNGMLLVPTRLPLRHLSLKAGPLPNSVALCRGNVTVILLQAANEQQFDLWVKTIAIELIRQTPLDAVKYLDILTLAKNWHQCTHALTFTTTTATTTTSTTTTTCCTNSDSSDHSAASTPRLRPTVALHQDQVDGVSRTAIYAATPPVRRRLDRELRISTSSNSSSSECSPAHSSSSSSTTSGSSSAAVDAALPHSVQQIELLLKKCQSSDHYVPVKEKLVLFETLCRLGRKVRSTEDMTSSPYVRSLLSGATPIISDAGSGGGASGAKRACSMHDLTQLKRTIAVREICKYFEMKHQQSAATTAALSPSSGHNVIRHQQPTSLIMPLRHLAVR